MTDLRDRIAAAIDRRYTEEAIGHTYEVCLHAADAVIRELGLREELRYPGRFSFMPPQRRRYVTEWETTE